MYCIKPKLVNNYSTSEELNNLINNIDVRVAQIAIVHLNNLRFGFDYSVNYDQYEDLITYRRILLKKLMGCNCLQDRFLIKIVSKIKNLIK